MATRDLLVRVLGDTRDVEAAFARSSRAASSFGASVDTTGKKADRAARSVSGFAKGALVGFGGAVAFTEGLRAIRSVIDAASESQQVLGQTRVALESTGKSWQQYGARIEDAIDAQSRLGFDDEALLRTFSLFVRQSRDVEEAIRRNSIAMNLARARFIDLEQAANLVNKAALGQAGALRRVGIDARNGASGVELLAQLEREFAGAAEEASNSAVGATDRMRVSLENVQEALGSLVIPKVAEFADTTSDAADKTEDLVNALGRLASVKVPPIRIPLIIDTGGSTVGDLFGTVKDAFERGAETQFPGLAFVRDLAELIKEQPNPDTKAAADAFDDKFDTLLESLEKDVDKSTKRANDKIKAFGQKGFKPLETNDLGDRLQAQFEAVVDALDLRFDQAQFAGNTQAALAVLDKTEQVIRQRIQKQGRTTDLMRQLFQVEQERATILRQGRETARRVAEEARELAREQAAAQREFLAAVTQRNQFKAIGLSGTGGAIIPTVDNLEKQLDQLTNRLGADITPKLAAQLKNVGKVLAGQFGKVTERTREAIRDLFQTIRAEFDKGTKEGPLTKTTSLNEDKLLAGLGLSRDLEKELRARLSSFNSAGVALAGANRPTGTGFVGGPITGRVVVENHNTVTLDGDVVGRNVTRSQQKNRRRNPKQKRGPNSGV